MEKPDKWPCNMRESRVENVYQQINKYIENPSLENKEVLVSLINQDELNEKDSRGLIRFSKYEYELLSEIYIKGSWLMINGIKVFVYRQIIDLVIHQHAIDMFPETYCKNMNNDSLNFCIPSLQLFFSVYYNYRYYEKKSFCDSLLRLSNEADFCNKKVIYMLCHALLTMLNDLSYNTNSKVFLCINFTREEIYKIYEMVFKCLNVIYPIEKINDSPLHGVLCTSISNWILKSRYDYNRDFIYKCLPNNAAFNYKEVWMRTIDSLNDKNEGKVINKVLSDKSWKKYVWMSIEDIKSIRKTYLTCFSKKKPTKGMIDKYGSNYYAYKSDRIADLIAPQFLYNNVYANGQGFFFDVIYDENLLKEELNFLASIIDLSSEDDNSKKDFFDDILQYWIYSIKEPEQWKDERERRYVFFFYDSYTYKNTKEENGFMKISSSLFMYPDFVNHDNCMFDQLYANVYSKLCNLNHKRFLFCKDCLYSDFDKSANHKLAACPNCGSNNITYINDN